MSSRRMLRCFNILAVDVCMCALVRQTNLYCMRMANCESIRYRTVCIGHIHKAMGGCATHTHSYALIAKNAGT